MINLKPLVFVTAFFVLAGCVGQDFSSDRSISAIQVVNAPTPKLPAPKSINKIAYKQYAKGKFKVGPKYARKGNSFIPRVDLEHEDEGYASWYGPGFHGRKTANGAIFNQNKYTAAHTTLPLPSVVRVTNLENNRTITVVVNDRGPFNNISHPERPRIIDLSKKAASTLGMMKKGVAKVKLEYLHDETKKLIAHMPKSQIKKAEAHFNDAMKDRLFASNF